MSSWSPLLAPTASVAEFAIENNVSTRASSCRKDAELGAGEAMAPRLQVQMPGEQSVLPPRGSAGVAVASSREEGGSGERTLASSWAVGSPLQVLLLGE